MVHSCFSPLGCDVAEHVPFVGADFLDLENCELPGALERIVAAVEHDRRIFLDVSVTCPAPAAVILILVPTAIAWVALSGTVAVIAVAAVNLLCR
jgi:hypothetical protein